MCFGYDGGTNGWRGHTIDELTLSLLLVKEIIELCVSWKNTKLHKSVNCVL